jgi:hypothetical protein
VEVGRGGRARTGSGREAGGRAVGGVGEASRAEQRQHEPIYRIDNRVGDRRGTNGARLDLEE